MTLRMIRVTQPAFPATKPMFVKLATSALFAGAAAGLIAGLLQLAFVQPVLLHAELFESGQLVHFGGQGSPAHADLPRFDAVRDLLSVFFAMLVYTGYAFVLLAFMSIAGENGSLINAEKGLIWGVAGFVTVHLAPSFSLAPELPGAAAADVGMRQIWWFATVFTTAAALVLLAFGRSWQLGCVAAILIIAPHLVGAPEPDVFTGPVPPELAALFAARALGVGLAAWVLLGSFAGFFWSREMQREAV
jgi:cobalt transporter subunit CbtA